LVSEYPVPVISEEGEYHGTLSKQDVVEILANNDNKTAA
jgi:hypothetical protein